MVSGQLIVYGTYSSTMSPSVCVEALEMMGENPCPPILLPCLITLTLSPADYFSKKGK